MLSLYHLVSFCALFRCLQEILQRTGYSHEVTPGQRKYGGPPPNWDGPAPGPGHEVKLSVSVNCMNYCLN